MAATAQIETIYTGDGDLLFHFSVPPSSSEPNYPLWLTLAEARQLIGLCVASSCTLGGDDEQLFEKLSAFWHTVTR